MELFKLPEKWCVLRTHFNYETVNQWFKDNNLGHPYLKSEYIAPSDTKSDDYMTASKLTDSIFKDYTEITYEQFLEYIVNKKPIIEDISELNQILIKLLTE